MLHDFFLKKLGVSINLKYKSSVYETEVCNSHDITEWDSFY